MMLPSPSVFLNHPSFPSWQPGQEGAFQAGMEWLAGPKRFLAVDAPTGSGKSLLAVLLAHVGNRRALILNHSRGQQDQYATFGRIGAVDLKGQRNYECLADSTPANRVWCDWGHCHDDDEVEAQCGLKRGGCLYFDRLREAILSKLAVTNYACYLALADYTAKGIGPRDLVVCDEAHLALGALESHQQVRLLYDSLKQIDMEFPGSTDSIKDWQEWIEEVLDSRRVRKRLKGDFEAILNADKSWIVEQDGSGFLFSPLQPESATLFPAGSKVLLMSATLTPKTLKMLGVPEEQTEWIHVPSYFPLRSIPVTHVNTVRVNARSSSDDIAWWRHRIDQIIEKRLDRKGIVHTVSYDRARYLLENSTHRDRMLGHTAFNTRQVVEKYKHDRFPWILVSPSLTTGWDFPDDECRYIIIGKVPYQYTNRELIRRRQEVDKEYTSYLAMETLVQEAGRGMRREDDWCEVFIVDDSWRWFWKQYKKFAPQWFWPRVQGSVEGIPEPIR